MDERVQKYIEELKTQRNAAYEAEKRANLIEWGLYERIESAGSGEESYYDADRDQMVYLRREPYPVTDEEYEELKKLNNEKEQTDKKTHSGSQWISILKGFTWFFMIAGILATIITGIVLYNEGRSTQAIGLVLSLVVPFVVFISNAFIMVFLQMAEDVSIVKKKLLEK